MTIGVPKEVEQGERRVAITPKYVKEFRKRGFNVLIEDGAGLESDFPNELYVKEGAKIVDTKTAWS
jgi:alanine dehydrogenase